MKQKTIKALWIVVAIIGILAMVLSMISPAFLY